MSMKSGASEDPFAEEETETETDETNADQPDNDETVGENQSGRARETSTRDTTTTGRQTEQTGQELPYIVRRKLQNKSIQHERDRVPFFLREPVLDGEKDFRRAVEDELEDDVPKADLREAAYAVAQRHVKEVVAELREMGYDWER